MDLEPAIQIDHNNIKQCLNLNQIEEEYQNEIIKIEKTISELQILMETEEFKDEREDIIELIEKLNKQKKKLINQLNEKKIKNIVLYQQSYKFRLMYQDPMNEYFSFVFNSNSTLLFAGGQRFIKVFKFKNGKKLLQTLTTPHGRIYSLIFMKKSNLLVSGGQGEQIVFWSQGKNSCWEPYQIIQGRTHLEGNECNIKFMIINEDENHLILYSYWGCMITSWKKVNTGWKLCEFMRKMLGGVSFSLNKSQTKLCMCCQDENIMIMEIMEDYTLNIKDTQTDSNGYQQCWISDSEFVFQGEQEFLEIYSLDLNYQKLYDCISDKENYYDICDFLFDQEDFKIKKKIKVQNTEKSQPSFPCKYLESMGILMVQNGKFLNFFGIKEGEFYLLQSIEFSGEEIYGNISNDGKFLITLDRKKNKTMQIRRLEYLS